MNPLDNPHSRESQAARSPGNRKKDSPKAQGNRFERKVKGELKGSRRNDQATAYGGCSNADIDFGDFAIETKDAERLEIPKWLRKKKSETPKNKKPGLIFTFEEEEWVTVKFADRMPFAHHLVQSEGGEVSY